MASRPHIKTVLAFIYYRGSLTPVPGWKRSEKSGCGCTRHPRITKPLLWKCCQIHRLLSQVTAERRLRTCRPRTRSEHKVSADAWAISPLQLSHTREPHLVATDGQRNPVSDVRHIIIPDLALMHIMKHRIVCTNRYIQHIGRPVLMEKDQVGSS